MTLKQKQFVCLEAGCQAVIKADTDEDLVQGVQQHMADVHNSFELDEFILAGATEAEAKD
jgi:predicted small metal-binding protein